MSDDGASREEQLWSACMTDQSDLVRELLQDPRSIDINRTNALGCTALHYAAQTGSVDCVELLVKAPGIKLDLQDRMGKNTPLHMALIRRAEPETTLEIVTLLTKAGADPRIANKVGQRPRDLAGEDDEEIQRVLLQAALTILAKEGQAYVDDGGDSDGYSSG
ncbi:hypothetical protein LPJ61_002641 [Coemansia biformis]|uniref:Ankyrin n=1 Tax=Coemansia biformis TaxID=1286918 RepID=A0A9W7YED8_9FUNG|nr:hypothetical protein LPJ61_002641 [Coemansia biformis]